MYNGSIVRCTTPQAAGGSEAWREESGTGLRCRASPPLNRWLCLQTYPGILIIQSKWLRIRVALLVVRAENIEHCEDLLQFLKPSENAVKILNRIKEIIYNIM